MKRKKRQRFVKMQDTQTEMKVGLIYREIARKRFDRLHPDIDKHEVDEILMRGDLDEIESYVEVKPGIEAVTRVLRRVLGEDELAYSVLGERKISLPKDFVDVMIYSEDPYYEVEEVKIGLDMLKLDHGTKAIMLFLFGKMWFEDKGNGGLQDSSEKELWKETCADYDFCEDILALVGLNLDGMT